MVNLVVLSLGTNEGDREKNIKNAVALLEKEFNIKLKKSPVYETPPLYFEDQPDFYNCCVAVKTALPAEKIFQITSNIENNMGRTRGMRHGPRIIDIDIVSIDDQVIADDSLTVPHPAMQDRLFVLVPLSDMLPSFVHPAMQLTVEELIEECPDVSRLKKIKDFWKEK